MCACTRRAVDYKLHCDVPIIQAGTANNETGATKRADCVDCLAGYYAAEERTETCTKCTTGASEAGAYMCQKCEVRQKECVHET